MYDLKDRMWSKVLSLDGDLRYAGDEVNMKGEEGFLGAWGSWRYLKYIWRQ